MILGFSSVSPILKWDNRIFNEYRNVATQVMLLIRKTHDSSDEELSRCLFWEDIQGEG